IPSMREIEDARAEHLFDEALVASFVGKGASCHELAERKRGSARPGSLEEIAAILGHAWYLPLRLSGPTAAKTRVRPWSCRSRRSSRRRRRLSAGPRAARRPR